VASSNKVIITCAITGAIHTPSMSPYLPVTADQIAEAAIGAAEAGGLRPIPSAHKAGDQGGRESDDRRRALHDRAGAGEAG
jgi:uncharacterized protein (DUF849 family)